MTKSIDEIITAAQDLNDRLLGTEATADDIQAALAEVCEGGTEEEQQWVLRLACEFALIICDPDEGLDEDRAHVRIVHYNYLMRQLAVRLGWAQDDWTEEKRQESYHERHVLYPLRE